MRIVLPKWNKTLNEAFIPLVHNKDRYIICYGGRGSSKSVWAAKKLIYLCLSQKHFRCIMVRNTYATIKDSSYQTLKDIIIEWGLQDLFEFKLQPLEIHCKNGNYFIARGCDDTSKMKSVRDATHVWYEEDIPTEEDFITITTSIRTTKSDYLQEIFTLNPEVEGNYQDHWFWKRFFEKHKGEKSFNDSITVTIKVLNKQTLQYEDKEVEMPYTVHHSTYLDNKWLPEEFGAFLLDLKRTNPYYYTIYCLGEWGNKQMGGLFYKQFNIGRNTSKFKYNETLPLHISFDFNVNPYMSCSIWQMIGKKVYQVDELAMKSPNNTTAKTCQEFIRKYHNHTAGLYIYGDPAGRHEDTRSEQGFNDFTIIERELAKYRPILRVPKKAPPVHVRGQFINTIFEFGYNDIEIFISEDSTYVKNDLLFGKEASDGTKLKEKVKVDGVSYEKYHHFSDNLDYFICAAFEIEFDEYQNGKRNIAYLSGGNYIPNKF